MNNKKIIVLLLIIIMIGIGILGAYKYRENISSKYPEYVRYTTINDEFFNSMTEKELMCYKVINSIDFYNNASGTYKKNNNISDEFLEIKYYVDVETNKSYIIMNDNNQVLIKDNKKFWMDKNKQTYKEYKIINEKDNDIPKLKVKDRFDDKEGFISRSDGNFLDLLGETLFGQNAYAYGLEFFDKWEIDEETTYLNRGAIKISGEYNYVGKTQEEKYNMVIDKATGIVLKYESFDNDNNVVNSLETTEIHVDEGISKDIFEIDLSKYKVEH